MPESFRAFTTDCSAAVRLQMKMDLPTGRDTVLSFFDRIRREQPEMNQFRRFKNELCLEAGSDRGEPPTRWIGIRKNSLRIGELNPPTLADALTLHRVALTAAPNYLNLSPLDIDYLEVAFGFDLLAAGNHDAIVADALAARGPIASLLNIPKAVPVSFQPVFSFTLSDDGVTQGQFEVKTRPARAQQEDESAPSPITLLCVVRQCGRFTSAADLPASLTTLARLGERLVEERLVPYMIKPIHEVIAANNL